MTRITRKARAFTASAALAVALLPGCTDAPFPVDPAGALAARGGTSGPTVTKTDPTGSPRGLRLEVRVFGSGFDAGTTVRFGIDGAPSPEVVTHSTRVVNSKELVADITITDNAEPNLYDVLVTTGGGKPGIGTELFEIIVLQDLGALSTSGTLGTEAAGMALNTTADPEEVTVVGRSSSGCCAYEYPMYWTAATGMRPLNAPPGTVYGWPQAVSDNGTIVGVLPSPPRRAFWTLPGAPMTELPMLSRGVGSEARGITPDGSMIVGINDVALPDNSDTVGIVVVWRSVSGAPDSVGRGWSAGIASDLTIAGWFGGPYVWTYNGTGWTGAPLPGPAWEVSGISPDGSRIVGSATRDQSEVAILWQRAGTTWQRIELPGVSATTTTKRRAPTSSSPSYKAFGVNSAGLIVGVNGNSAVLWYPEGTGYKGRIMPEASRFGGSWAQAINDNNQVTGKVKVSLGAWHAVLWTLP